MQKFKIYSFLKDNKYKILLIIWMGIIFTLSSIPNLKSDIPGINDLILRKMAHFVEYFILMFLCIKSFYKDIQKDLKIDYKLGFCFIFCSLYSLSDEMHQLFVPTRHFALFDYLIDNFGLVSCLVLLFVYKNKKTKLLEK